MPVIKEEIEELKEIHQQVEKLIVVLTSSLQIILSGTSFEESAKEKIRAQILKDAVRISERLADVINKLTGLDTD